MGAEDSRRVHFQSLECLVERLHAIADLMGTNRKELLVEGMRAYIDEPADSDAFQQRVATAYYADELDFETVKQFVGPGQAQRLRLLKADLEDEPFDLNAPDSTDIYDGDAVMTGD